MNSVRRVRFIFNACLVLLVSALALAQPISSDSTQPAGDPIVDALVQAKAQHQRAVEAARQRLLAMIDRQINAATCAGDLAMVRSLQLARTAAAVDGSIPADLNNPAVLTAKAEYDRIIAVARIRMAGVYETAVRAYTRAGKLDKAQATQEEFDSLTDNDPTLCPPPIDLLQLVNPDRDAISGRWHLQKGELSNDAMDGAQIRFPYRPPAEYNFHLVYTRASADYGMELGICQLGHQFGCGMPNAHTPDHCNLNGLTEPLVYDAPKDAVTVCDVVVRVRAARLVVIINGQESIDRPIEPSDFTKPPAWWDGPDKFGLGIIDWYGQMNITRAEVTELSGAGEKF